VKALVPQDVDRFIEAFWDHPAWSRECLTIPDKHGRVVPFDLMPGQVKLDAAIEEQRRRGRPVRIVFLKARQVTLSAGCAAEFFHRVPFQAGQKALVVAHDKDSTSEIFGYYENFQQVYQPFGGVVRLPEKVATRSGNVLRWANGSYIKVATANNLKAGRSKSLRFLHLSEFAFWRDAKTLMPALMAAVPDDPDTMVIVESTANGVGGGFWELWQKATDTSNPERDWIAVFLGSQEHPEYVRQIEGPRDVFLRSLSAEEADLMDHYQATPEYLNWRRWAIENNCQGSVDLFHQEYPTRPEEAFLTTGRPRFSHAALSRMPVIHDALVGDLEEYRQGVRTITEFVPKTSGALTVYRKPTAGKEYVIGCDVSQGIDISAGEIGSQDPDWSVAWVVDRDLGEQVAKIRAHLEPSPFGQYVAALAAWYNWAFIVPEVNGPGIAMIEELLRSDYPAALIYHRRPQADDSFSAEASAMLQHLGFQTNLTSRIQLISQFDRAIREMSVIIRDPHSLQECYTFIVKANGKAEHQNGCHDDEVIAGALCVAGLLHPPPDRRMMGFNRRPPGVPRSGTTGRYGARRFPKEARRGERVRL